MERICLSMSAFVVSLISMIVVLEEKLEGIKTKRLGNQKLKMLADDVKLFLRETKEIQTTHMQI